MRKFGLALVWALVGCGGTPEGVDLTHRAAAEGECPNGGMVLAIDGEEQTPLCNGENGANGTPGTNGRDGTNGTNGTDGADGANGANGTNGANAAMPPLVLESVFCAASSSAPAPFRGVTYQHSRLYDGSLLLAVSCDTSADQDAATRLYSVDQVGASSGAMECILVDETNAVINIDFAPNFLTRRLQVTEDEVVVVDVGFDTDCTVVTP